MEQIDRDILKPWLERIVPANKTVAQQARNHWDHLVHPIGSLGQLEELTIEIASMKERVDFSLDKRILVVMAGDNGIMEEGVTTGYAHLTSSLVDAMVQGKTGACALAKDAKMDVLVMDLGTRREGEADTGFFYRKARHRPETSNFLKEPAMTMEETLDCITIGAHLADELSEEGYDLIGTGELGIGNTTTAAAVMAGLLHLPGEKTCGFGAGVSEEGLTRKISVVDESEKLYQLQQSHPIEILQCVGGYDIAGLTGLFLGAAANKIPIIIDGFISAVAALVATRLAPNVKDYLLASHLSCESQMKIICDALGVKPVLHLDMRLGEGSGCPLLCKLLDGALFAMKEMGTFSEVDILGDVLVNLRKEKP